MANREVHQYSAGTSSGAARSCGTASPLDIDAQCVRRCPEGSLLLPLTHPPAMQIERPDICEQRFNGSRRSPRVVILCPSEVLKGRLFRSSERGICTRWKADIFYAAAPNKKASAVFDSRISPSAAPA